MVTSTPPPASNAAPQARSAPLHRISRQMTSAKPVRAQSTRHLTTAERIQARDEATKRLRELYDQGVRFFSKDVFQQVVEKLERCRADSSPSDGAKPHTISIPAVDGTEVVFQLATGSVKPCYPHMELENAELVIGEPYLHYRTVDHLTRSDDIVLFDPDQAYSSIHIVHPLLVRDITTKEFLVPSDCDSLEDLRAAFAAGIKTWEESEDCKSLRSLFEGAASLPKVSKIVAFACSTMAGYKKSQLRTIHQHALILTLRDIFSSRHSQEEPEIKCFAQDPAYTKTDEEVLVEAGITVLRDPRGFLEVDDESIVISVSPNIPVREIVANIARPAVLIWNHVKTEAEADAFWREREWNLGPGAVCDPESSRVRAMVQDHYREPVTLGPEEMFGNTSVYIRRE